MRIRDRVRRLALVGVLVFLGAGCAGGDGPKPKLAPVRGRVVFKGEPLAGAEIYFRPDASRGNQGKMASGAVLLDGSFTMFTSPDEEGVMPGAYKVTLGLGRRSEKELVKYRAVETTRLECSVPDEGKTDVVFVLE
jgi:hypothetical protein